VPTNESQPFSFGYLYKDEYRVVSIDTTKGPHFNDSAAFWGWLEDDGQVGSYFPVDIQSPPHTGQCKVFAASSSIRAEQGVSQGEKK
jgi:hypothetical protein